MVNYLLASRGSSVGSHINTHTAAHIWQMLRNPYFATGVFTKDVNTVCCGLNTHMRFPSLSSFFLCFSIVFHSQAIKLSHT